MCGHSIRYITRQPFLLFFGKEQTSMIAPWGTQIWSKKVLLWEKKILTEQQYKACRWKHLQIFSVFRPSCVFCFVSFNTSSWRRMMMIMMRENHSGSCFKQMVKATLLLDLTQRVAHSASWWHVNNACLNHFLIWCQRCSTYMAPVCDKIMSCSAKWR